MPDTFTPEQNSQILEEFFKVVGTRQYIGARYVPIFGRKDEESIEWDNTAPYEPLTIVLYQGNSYTSRQFVPVGVEITNQEFWALTGNYNAQVEQYRRDVAEYKDEVEVYHEEINEINGKIDTIESDVFKQYLSEAQFTAKVRREMPNGNSAQGFCVFGDGGQYCAIACPTTNDESGFLNIYYTESNTFISSTEIGMGHANTLSCRNNVICVMNTNNNNVVFIDVSNVLNPTVIRNLDLTSLALNIRTICWLDDNTLLGCAYSNRVFNLYEIDATTGALKASHNGAYINTYNLTNQGIAVSDDYIYICMCTPNTLIELNRNDFTIHDIYQIPDRFGYIDITELEQVYIHEGKFYLSFQPMTFYTSVVPTVVVCEPNAQTYYLKEATVNGQYNIDVSDTGSEIIVPTMLYRNRIVFKFIEDAINFSVNARRVIGISGTYSHNAVIRNANVDLLFRENSTLEAHIEFIGCTLTIESRDGAKFANNKTTSNSVYAGQSTQLQFVNSNVDIISLPSQTVYDYDEHLTRFSEFTFAFMRSNIKSGAALYGFIARRSVIQCTNSIVSSYVIIENCVINCSRICGYTDKICHVSSNTLICAQKYIIGTSSASSENLGLTYNVISNPIPIAYGLHLASSGSVSMISRHHPIPQNDSGADISHDLVILTERADHTLKSDHIHLESIAWPTQLTNATVTLYGLTAILDGMYASNTGAALSDGSKTVTFIGA